MRDPEKPSANQYTAIYEGVVTQNEDPKKIGRVKIRVPGILDDPESGWALPVGSPGGGTAQRGMFDVPKVEAEVFVFFAGGDIDKPRFFTGHWGVVDGESEVPEDARDAMEEDGPAVADQIKTYQTNSFIMTYDEREGKERFYVKRKRDIDGVDDEDLQGGNALMIELDATNGTAAISAPGGIILSSLGLIDINGTSINIGGRKVIVGISDPI
jgi:uncharacterized protein involved in type VI secretion and phage assembly